jgi:hypothetical protein
MHRDDGMVIFCNRDNTHGCVKVLYPSRRVTFNASDVFVDIGLSKALGDGVDVVDYLNYVLFVAKSNPNSHVLAIVPDAWGDAPKNVWLASEFYIRLRSRREEVPSNLTMLIVVHGGLIDTYWLQYKILYFNYSKVVSTGFAVPSRKMDLSHEPIDCNRKPLQCSQSIRAFIARARQELGNNVPTHLLGANKNTLTALGEYLRFVYSFDSDAYRLVPNDEIRRKCLGDGRFMIDENRCSPKMWAQAWLGELEKYVVVQNAGD